MNGSFIVVLITDNQDPEIRPIAFDRLQTRAHGYLNSCPSFDVMKLVWKGEPIACTKEGKVWTIESDLFTGRITEIEVQGQLNLGYTVYRKLRVSDLSKRDAEAIAQPKIEVVKPRKRSAKK